MSKLSLGAILLLLPACGLARVSTLLANENPTINTQSAQLPSKSTTATIEGCLSENVDNFVLTAANGRTYELTGDAAQLTGRVGHQVRLWGQDDAAADAELITAGGPHTAFGVEKVRSLSSSCK